MDITASDRVLLVDALATLDRLDTLSEHKELRDDIRDELGPFRLIREGSGHCLIADRDPVGTAAYAAARGLRLITEWWTDRRGDVGCLHYWVKA